MDNEIVLYSDDLLELELLLRPLAYRYRIKPTFQHEFGYNITFTWSSIDEFYKDIYDRKKLLESSLSLTRKEILFKISERMLNGK